MLTAERLAVQDPVRLGASLSSVFGSRQDSCHLPLLGQGQLLFPEPHTDGRQAPSINKQSWSESQLIACYTPLLV